MHIEFVDSFSPLQSCDWCHPGRAGSEPPPHWLTAAGTDFSDGCSGRDLPWSIPFWGRKKKVVTGNSRCNKFTWKQDKSGQNLNITNTEAIMKKAIMSSIPVHRLGLALLCSKSKQTTSARVSVARVPVSHVCIIFPGVQNLITDRPCS